MDGHNVNLIFLSELKQLLKNDEDPHGPEMTDIGTCSLHVVHGAHKTAHDKCGWNLQFFAGTLLSFQGLFIMLYHTPSPNQKRQQQHVVSE